MSAFMEPVAGQLGLAAVQEVEAPQRNMEKVVISALLESKKRQKEPTEEGVFQEMETARPVLSLQASLVLTLIDTLEQSVPEVPAGQLQVHLAALSEPPFLHVRPVQLPQSAPLQPPRHWHPQEVRIEPAFLHTREQVEGMLVGARVGVTYITERVSIPQ